jgi:MFS family permease
MQNTSAPAGADPAPASLYPWYVIFVLLLAQTFSFLDRMIMGIPLARIADSRNRRNLIALGIAVWSFMTALCGLAKSFWALFFARVGVGVGEAALGPAAYSMITDYFPRTVLGRALSIYMLGVTIGSGFAYMLGGSVVAYVQTLDVLRVPLLGEIEGWQATFFIVGLPGLLVALLMRTTVAEPPRGVPSNHETDSEAALPIAAVVRYIWERRRAYGSHIFGVSIFIMVVYALNLWGPTYLIRTFGYSIAQAGWTFGILMLSAGSAGLLLAGIVADRKMAAGVVDAYPRVILWSMLGMLPCTIALGFASSPAAGIAALSLAVFFSAFQGGISGGTLQLMTPNRMRGQVMAVYLLVANLIGLGLGPTVLAATTDYVFGSDQAIGQAIALVGAVLCPLGALILWRGLPAMRQELAIANAAD